MRRDTIFYQLFKRSPTLLFELLESSPDRANEYRFDSVAVKEPKFEIDGVFLPPESNNPGIVYFCEVQFQADQLLYERMFAESLLYFYQNREQFLDWRSVLIYPTRSLEQSRILPYEDLIHTHRTTRIYLDELGEIASLPLGVALMVLTIVDEELAPKLARDLLTRSKQEVSIPEVGRGIIEMIATVMTYKFINLTRQEVEAMIGVTFQETRVYRDAKEEGRQEERLKIVNLFLKQKLGTISRIQMERIEKLLPEQMERLTIALLSFETKKDLKNWLDEL
jgi:predicted transposase/invertase (TIGR01784 family)